MRSLLDLLQSLGPAGARENARAELVLAHSRQVQAVLVARRVGGVDTSVAQRDATQLGRPGIISPAA